jgi:hypothetical protein
MARSRRVDARRGVVALVLFTALAGCAGDTGPGPTPIMTPVAPAIPATVIAGRWGLAAYQREEDRLRTEQQARGVCGNPYEIALGPNGGVMMHPADGNERVELAVKGAAGNRTFIGPSGDPGGPEDREIISYDGQVMVMRWLDPEVARRYGTLVFARCGDGRSPTAGRPPASRPAPARKGQ